MALRYRSYFHRPIATYCSSYRQKLPYTIEVCTPKGLVTHYILFFIDTASRSVHIAGVAPHPGSEWMMQIARNITDAHARILRGKGYLILDRDAKYCDEFRKALAREGVHVIRLPWRA